jgi:hypothetical protein
MDDVKTLVKTMGGLMGGGVKKTERKLKHRFVPISSSQKSTKMEPEEMPGQFPGTPESMAVKNRLVFEIPGVSGETPQIKTKGIPGWFPATPQPFNQPAIVQENDDSTNSIVTNNSTTQHRFSKKEINLNRQVEEDHETKSNSFDVGEQIGTMDSFFENQLLEHDGSSSDQFRWSVDMSTIPAPNRRQRLLESIQSPYKNL